MNSKFEELQERTTKAELRVATFQEAYNQKAHESLTTAISEITDEVTQLSKYCRTNYAGFLKIVKKHDVSCLVMCCLFVWEWSFESWDIEERGVGVKKLF